MPMCWQCGGLGEERLGLSWASHRWFHLAPKRTTAGHGWALQAKWWHLGGNIVKEKPATMPHRQTSREQEGWETAEDTSRSKEMVLHTLGRYSPTAHAEMPEAISHAVPGGPALGQVSMTRMDCSWWRSHTGAGENCNEEGRAERTWSQTPIPCLPCTPQWVGTESQVKGWTWAQEREEEKCGFNVCLLVSHHLNLF